MKKICTWFLKGFAAALGTAAGGWLALRIPQVREPVIAFLFLVAPPARAVLPITAFLYLLGFGCLAVSLGIYLVRARKIAAIRRRFYSVELTVDDVAYMESLHDRRDA